MWSPQILRDYSSRKTALDSIQSRTKKKSVPERRSLLNSLVDDVEEECERTSKEDTRYVFSSKNILCNKCEVSEFVGAETKLFYSRLNDSYIPIKYVVSQKSSESLQPTAWDKVDKAAGSTASSCMTGNCSSTRMQTEKKRGYTDSTQNIPLRSAPSKSTYGQSSFSDASPVKKVRSQVERIWNDYHQLQKPAENKALPDSHKHNDSRSSNRESKSTEGVHVARISAGKVYDGAMAWAKAGSAGTDDIKTALSGIKQMFHSGCTTNIFA